MQRSVRILLPWLDRDEAINFLLGQLPQPGQDISAELQLWEAQRNALASRPSYALATPTLDPLPEELSERAEEFKQRPDVKSVFGNLDWQVGMVSLESVLSFQKYVALEQAEERVAEATQGDLDRLFSVCLPDQKSEEVAGLIDQVGKSLTFSSLNPNLRVVANMVQELQVANDPNQMPQRVKFVGFAINLGASFIQIAEYNCRWFVRDGYHRCYGLLKKGISKVPCVFIRARNFSEVGADLPPFIKYEALFGARPPFLKDFLDQEVSAPARQRATRKVVRILADEFVVDV